LTRNDARPSHPRPGPWRQTLVPSGSSAPWPLPALSWTLVGCRLLRSQFGQSIDASARLESLLRPPRSAILAPPVGQGQVEHQSHSGVQPARRSHSLCYVSLGSATASPPACGCTPRSPQAASLRSSTHRTRRSRCDCANVAPRARARCARVASSIASFLAPFWSRLRRGPERVIVSSSPSWLTLINALAHARP